MEWRPTELTLHLVNVLTAASIGLGVGVFFFGTLWLTVRRIVTSKRPHLLVFGGFVVRAAIAVAAFYLLADDGPLMVLVAVAAFVVSRGVLVRYLAPGEKERAVR